MIKTVHKLSVMRPDHIMVRVLFCAIMNIEFEVDGGINETVYGKYHNWLPYDI